MVASIDVVGGKVVKRMAGVERPRTPPSADEDGSEEIAEVASEAQAQGGAFSRNPLLGQMVRPVARVEKGGAEAENGGGEGDRKKSQWRRVQDDKSDNEQWILDGGVYEDYAAYYNRSRTSLIITLGQCPRYNQPK
ncbi:hypothetical protein LTR28_009237 [Elasticomyces elasticus]|nr:hypothetical protein LTR28_009237 [Elasticomyces elasticus]